MPTYPDPNPHPTPTHKSNHSPFKKKVQLFSIYNLLLLDDIGEPVVHVRLHVNLGEQLSSSI
jgi:hypothetical protein